MKPPISDADSEIAERLRRFRESLKLTQAQFAEALGIKRDRLASYEDKRVALPWGVFRKLAVRFRLNPFWLAKEEGYSRAPFTGDLYEVGDYDRMPFSTVMQRFKDHVEDLAGDLPPIEPEELREAADVLLASLDRLGAMDRDEQREILQLDWLAPQFAELQQALGTCLAEADLTLAGQTAKSNLRKLWQVRRELARKKLSEAAQKKVGANEDSPLQSYPKGEYEECVPEIPTVEALLAEVRDKTKRRGAKSELAKILGVPLSRLSEWLSDKEGTRAPNAERALLLRKWVNRQR